MSFWILLNWTAHYTQSYSKLTGQVWLFWILFDKLFYSTIPNDNTTSWHDWALPPFVPLSTSAWPSHGVSPFVDVQPCVWKLLFAAAPKIDVTSHNERQSLLTIRKPMEQPSFLYTSITSLTMTLRVHFSALSTHALMTFMVSQLFLATHHILHNANTTVKSIKWPCMEQSRT